MIERWDERVARARRLASEYPAAAEILTFYAALAEYQKALLEKGSGKDKRSGVFFASERPSETDSRPRVEGRFFDAVNLEVALAAIPEFLAWLYRQTPPQLAHAASEMRVVDLSTWRDRMVAYLRHADEASANSLSPGAPAAAAEHAGRGPQRGSRAGVLGARQREWGPPPLVASLASCGAQPAEACAASEGWWGPTSNEKGGERVRVRGRPARNEIAEFIIEAVLQPFAEAAAMAWREAPSPPDGERVGVRGEAARCPVCGSRPVVGVLREEGQSSRRRLVCAVCLTEWEYLRILCPGCAEQRFDALPVYVADEFPHIRIEACESCHCYLKTIDRTKNGLAVPLVDDIASLSLDLWARDRGYVRLRPNLLRI